MTLSRRMLMLGALLALLAGCAVRYDKGHGVYGAVACVNVTGPGFSWLCPDKLQVPQIPEAPQPSIPK